jgi:hypothetical protein
VLDGPPERTGQIGVDAEGGDNAHDEEHDCERVGAVGPQLLVYVISPSRPDRDSRTPLRGPPP